MGFHLVLKLVEFPILEVNLAVQQDKTKVSWTESEPVEEASSYNGIQHRQGKNPAPAHGKTQYLATV